MIKFTRHAKNRLRLYDISVDLIENAIKFPDRKSVNSEGNVTVWKTISGLKLKIIYTVEENHIYIITVIPL